ncbi:MAG TPA: FAD-dependent oxidoreductase [Roseiarcus sp.]
MSSHRSGPLRVAVIGGGVSGLSAAWLLAKTCDVTLYEAEPRLGGHSDTFDWDGAPVDCGFIVYNERTYPNLTALFSHLRIRTRESDMSFAASIDDGAIEYSGAGLRGLVAQPANLLRPRYWSMLSDIARFFREARKDVGRDDLGPLETYLDRRGYGAPFRDHYLYPMAAAVWSTPAMRVGEYPAELFIRFSLNHGLLDLIDRPTWRTVIGGSRVYVSALAEPLGRALTGRAAVGVKRTADGVDVADVAGQTRRYDRLVLATHADEALRLIDRPTGSERELLGAFRYIRNDATLHTDWRAMPRRRAAWASWNYIAKGRAKGRSLSVTYWMNSLQSLPGRPPVFLSLNPLFAIPDSRVLRRMRFAHPMFTDATLAAQKRLWSLQGVGDIWFCGAYFGYGFHEDGLQAGLAVAEEIGGVRRPWSVQGENDRLLFGAARRDAAPLAVAP